MQTRMSELVSSIMLSKRGEHFVHNDFEDGKDKIIIFTAKKNVEVSDKHNLCSCIMQNLNALHINNLGFHDTVDSRENHIIIALILSFSL